jgi:hypothetical protein
MSAGWGPFPPVHQQAHIGRFQGTPSCRDQQRRPGGRRSNYQSGTSPTRPKTACGEDAGDQGKFLRERNVQAATRFPIPLLAWCEPSAIAREFQAARMDRPARRTICGLAARPGEETSAGCGLAQSRVSEGRILRRAEGLTHRTTFPGAVDKKTAHPLTASSSRRARLPCACARTPSASVARVLQASKGFDAWQG